MVEAQTLEKHWTVEITTVRYIWYKKQKKFMVSCGSVVNQLLTLDRKLCVCVCVRAWVCVFFFSVKQGKLPKDCICPSTCYVLTPCSRVLLEKPTGPQLVNKFPAFYGTRRFISAFTSGLSTCILCISVLAENGCN
jgi:hypothetical protein